MTLDVKLATALLAFFKDDQAHVTETSQIMFLLIDEHMETTGKVARGRQVLNALWHNLTSGIYTTTVVTWQTLAGVQLVGNNLTDFNHRWYKALKEIRFRPDDLSLVEMLVSQLRKSPVLADSMTYFENLPINHRDRTYPWLLSMMQKHIHKHHEKGLQRELESCKGKPQMTLLGDAKQQQWLHHFSCCDPRAFFSARKIAIAATQAQLRWQIQTEDTEREELSVSFLISRCYPARIENAEDVRPHQLSLPRLGKARQRFAISCRGQRPAAMATHVILCMTLVQLLLRPSTKNKNQFL